MIVADKAGQTTTNNESDTRNTTSSNTRTNNSTGTDTGNRSSRKRRVGRPSNKQCQCPEESEHSFRSRNRMGGGN